VAAAKGFAGTYYKDEEDVAKGSVAEGVICYKDEEDEQRRKELVASLVKVELRQLWRDTVIISLSSTSVSVSLSFVQTCCSSS
jgi:hypothetical protein